jgi:MFS family permease
MRSLRSRPRRQRGEGLVSGPFLSLWLGDAAARLGFQTVEFLLPLLAVTALNTSPLLVGFVTASQFIPLLFLSLLAGRLAGRVDGKTLLIVCNAARAASLVIMVVVAGVLGLDYWLLIAVALVIGSVTIVYDVAYQSTVPSVLAVGQLVSGNSVLQASTSVTQMAGPALAGVLAGVAGLSPAVWVTAAMFAAAVLGHGFLSIPGAGRSRGGAADVSVRAGLRFTWKCRPIRDLCAQSGMFNFHEQAFLTAFLIYGIRSLHLSSGVVGTIVGLGSVGALVGSIAIGRLARRVHVGAVVSAALPVAALAFLLGSVLAAGVSPALILAGAFITNGVALAFYNVLAISLRQAIPPKEFLAAATASYRMVSFGTIPLGALFGGFLVGVIGPAAAVIAIAASLCVTSLSLVLSPLRRVRSVEDATALGAVRPPESSIGEVGTV